jgi:hypothetical protein
VAFFRQQADALSQEFFQANRFAQNHHEVVPVHHEEGRGLSSGDRVSRLFTNIVQRDEHAARECGLTFDLAPENQQVRLWQGVLFPLGY